MKVVLTLMARDEVDVVDAHIRYHLEAGVDFVIATDHSSVDGTTEILRRYERERHLHLIHEGGETYRQFEWVTRMARPAAAEFGADWVINSDADEFWWPRQGTLREVLEAVPQRFGAIRGIWRHFVLRPETEERFFERMVVRRLPSRDVANPYCANAKVVHRGARDVVVRVGNHDVTGAGLTLLRQWTPFEVLHFPIRSREQLEQKYTRRITSTAEGTSLQRHVAAVTSGLQADAERVYREFLVDDDTLTRDLAAGMLSVDTRLRDRLRGGTATPTELSLADDAAFAAEVDAMLTLDSARRLADRAESLEERLAFVETRTRRTRREVV